MAKESRDLSPPDESEKPDAVDEAEHSVRHLGFALAGTGVLGSALWWLHVLGMGFPLIPLSWLGIFLVALVLFFFFPQTRKARLARDILRHWDDVQIRGLLEASGASTDPRLQAADRMGRRIARHPGATEEMRQIAADLLSALRQTTRDQRLVEVMLDARRASGDAADTASLADAQDYVEARAGRLLGALADLHSGVVKRDAKEVSTVLTEAAEILAELGALEEVDRLLANGDE